MKKIYEMTARELHASFMEGKYSALQIAEAFLERVEATEERVKSFVSLRGEKLREEARALDAKKARGEALGSLAGVVVALKDNMLSKGDITSSASKILGNYEGVYDATVVSKLRNADALILGHTNMDEFAMGSTTKTSYHKMTSNPYDLSRVPGGSSGGAASSVAAQQVALSLGSDTGGSIRQPAAFCGVVGLKPSYGRVSRYGLMAFASSLDQIGPMGKTVEDVAMAMNVIAGGDDYDATLEDIEVPDYTEYLGKDIRGMKIGVPKEYFIEGIRAEVKQVVEDSIQKLKDLGAEIVEISLAHTKYAVPTYYVLAPAEASSNLARFDGVRYGYRSQDAKNIEELYVNSRTEGFGDEVKRRIMIGTYVLSAGFYDAYFKKAQKVRRLIQEDFHRAFEKVDVIVTPVTPSTAFQLSEEKTPIELYLEDIFTIPANLAGIPGISVPAGLVNGLPVGIQFLAKAFHEGDLLQVGSAFEKIRGEWLLANLD